MSAPSTLISAVNLTPERRQGCLTLDDVYSPTSDDLVAVLAGMVEDSNRYFKTFQEHEEHAAKQADQILNLLQEQATLQAQLDDECSVTQLQALELQACRRLLRGAGRNDAKRHTRDSMISIHELNEQLQLAATKYERERSLREKMQADLKAVQIELAQCKREKQELMSKVAHRVHVDAQLNAATKQAREQRDSGRMKLSSQRLFTINATGQKSKPVEPADALNKEQPCSTELYVSQPDDSEAMTPLRCLSVMPLQPITSDSSAPGTSSHQAAVPLEDCHGSPLKHPLGPVHGSQDAECDALQYGISCMGDVAVMQGSNEQPLMPFGVGELIGSASLTQHLSTEDAPQQEPSSVMCSQVFQGMAVFMRRNPASECAAIHEECSGGKMLSNTSSPEILTSHPIEAFASNETSENVLEDQLNASTSKADAAVKGDAMATRSTSHVGHAASTWNTCSGLRQDSSPNAEMPADGVTGRILPSAASLECQLSSVSLAESDVCLSLSAAIQVNGASHAGDYNVSISRASSCSHDENLHRSATPNGSGALPPLSVRCPNRTPFKHSLADTRKDSTTRPLHTASIDRARARDSHARLVDTSVKTVQGHHVAGPKQEWRLGGSSLRVRPDSGRPKTASVKTAASTLGPPATPRRVKVISPHKARTPDMSRLLGTPKRQRPSSQRKLAARSSLDDLQISRRCSQGGSARRATIAPGTLLPCNLKYDLKHGSQGTHQEKQRWL